MSRNSYRVNKLEYNDYPSRLFLNGRLRGYLEENNIIYVSENEIEEELNIESLEKFIEDYVNKKIVLENEIEEEIKELDLIDFLKEEVEFAKENKKDSLLYHIY